MPEIDVSSIGVRQDCSTGSQSVSHFQKLNLYLTNFNLIQTDLWHSHKGLNPWCDKLQTRSYYRLENNLMGKFSLVSIIQQQSSEVIHGRSGYFKLFRHFRWLVVTSYKCNHQRIRQTSDVIVDVALISVYWSMIDYDLTWLWEIQIVRFVPR